jgi:hypothetical protein
MTDLRDFLFLLATEAVLVIGGGGWVLNIVWAI